MTSEAAQRYSLSRTESHWLIAFSAMAGPCEILARCDSQCETEDLASLAVIETRRIERKFSRYRDDNIIYAINHSAGAPVEVDEELARLLTYADQCYQLSDGLFDITSGVLRRAWKFDCSVRTPDVTLIASLLEQVGWDKVAWDGHTVCLRPGMEIDLGGIGKEYAVDRVTELLSAASGAAFMINFGGDIRGRTTSECPDAWIVGIEDPGREDSAVGEIQLTNGGVATSGDLRRYCIVDGARLGHILNPRTGWPVADAPRSVTVLGSYCAEAGLLATLAMLQGADAERFLEEQGVQAHCIR